ncbi:MAG: hypothetical protein J6S91_04045 [Treponema sp.]|nr:hypothetical protein [Treponema sp.]
MRTNKIIEASVDEIEKAKETAVTLSQDSEQKQVMDLFYSENLEEVENGIRHLNEFASKSWLLASILLYTMVYDNNLYAQSGRTWADYSKQARERLGLDKRDVSDYLSAARFFIKNHLELEQKGFVVAGSWSKLARAEMALELSGNVHKVIDHLVKDSWSDFREWYQGFKETKAIQSVDSPVDIQMEKSKVVSNGEEVLSLSKGSQESDRMAGYIKKIVKCLQDGYEPAIIPVYDKREATALQHLLDKYRQGK